MRPRVPDHDSSAGLLMVTVRLSLGLRPFSVSEFFSKNEIAWRPKSKNQRDLAWPTGLGEITCHAHHGSDTDAPPISATLLA